jgi:bacterial/archaeal transporter family-2 protein
MKAGWMALAMLSGFLIPPQVAMNARMRDFVLSPTFSALLNFAVGFAAIALVLGVALAMGQPVAARGALHAPWWAWCGGLIGALFITTGILTIPRIGSANYSAAVIAGQLLGAILLDHLGLLHVPQFSLSWSRIGGALLLLAGVWLIQRN